MPREYERFPRPTEAYYESRFPYLSQGDLFEDVPFGLTGPELVYLEEAPSAILQPIVARRGVVVSPTCDFRRPDALTLERDPSIDPYTLQGHLTMVPLYPVAEVAARWGANREANLHLLRRFDALRRYMYLPPLPGEPDDREWIADLSRPDSVALALIARLIDGRLAQLTFAAAQQLQYKLTMAATAVVTDRSAYLPPMD